MKLIPKILLSILTTAALLFGGFIALLFTALGGGLIFHQVMVVTAFVIIWLFLLMQIWKLLKPKTRYIAAGAAALVVLLSIAGFEIDRAYHLSVEKIDEQGVNLSLYDPFREDTLAASLHEPSTLTLTDNLPRLDGATALYPVYSAFVRAVYPADFENFVVTGGDIEAEIKAIPVKPDAYEILACTNTDGAYRRLIEGQTDIIFAAGPSEEQLQMAREAGVELTLTPIGREAFVFFVNAQNPVDGLLVSDIRRIYSGEVTNWHEFGGKKAKIRAFQRPENSGSQTALIGFMGDVPLTRWEPPQATCPNRCLGILRSPLKNMSGSTPPKGAPSMSELDGSRLLTYSRVGDYLLPDLTLNEPPEELTEPLGKYGRMRRNFLKEHRAISYNTLLLNEELYPHLREIDQIADERMELLMKELAVKNPPPDKAADPMGWTAHMNGLKAQAEELILNDLIYN